MNKEKRLFIFMVILQTYFVSFTFAIDSDYDTLPDDWEIANGRDPTVADYGMVLGETWRCIKSDAGVSCVGTGYPAEPVFTTSLADINFIEPYEFILNQCDYSGTSDVVVSLDTNDLYVQVTGQGSSTCPSLVNHVIDGEYHYLGFSGVAQLYDGSGYFCALDNNGISCFVDFTVFSGTQLGQDLYSLQWGLGYFYDTEGGVLFDSDGDGIHNDVDPDRLVADTDGDGVPNDVDWDDDNDGVPDTVDAAPLDSDIIDEIKSVLDPSYYKGVLLRGRW